jgi:hypothetical protein
MLAGTDFIYYFINYVGYWGGVVWMPILGYFFGELIESLLLRSKKQKTGGLLGAVVGLVFWIVMISPRIATFF